MSLSFGSITARLRLARDVLQFDTPASLKASARLRDPFEKTRIVFQLDIR
jgi:hypothetical protein